MESHIQPQPSRLRCYRCGSPNIKTVCHHCGRPMCRRHGPVRPLLRWLTENREFTHFSLDHRPLDHHEGIHCEECLHSSPNYRRLFLYPGLLVLMIGLWLLVVHSMGMKACLGHRPPQAEAAPIMAYAEIVRDPMVYQQKVVGAYCYAPRIVANVSRLLQAFLMALFGLGMVILGAYMNRERVAADLAGWRPPLPVGPVTEVIRVVEYWQAKQILEANGSVRVRQTAPVEGRLEPGFQFTVLDQQRYREYLQKYDLAPGTSLSFSGGFLALRGRPAIQWVNRAALAPGYDTLLWLRGRTDAFPYLEGDQSQSNLWPWQSRYQVALQRLEHAEIMWEGAPVRILPLLESQENRYRLRLDVQFQWEAFPILDASALIEIRVLNLKVDPAMGRPKPHSGMVHQNHNEEAFQVTWRNLRFQARERHFLLPPVDFEQPVLPGAQLEGELILRVPALVSGLSQVFHFSALGYPVKGVKFSGTMEIILSFRLALATIPRTQVLVRKLHMPISGSPNRDQFEALVGTLHKIALEKGSAGSWVVNQVLTEPPRFSEQSAEGYRWYWDVRGRRYQDTLPVDFHLVLYGTDQGWLDITVQGQSFDHESAQAVENALTGLKEIARMALLKKGEEKA